MSLDCALSTSIVCRRYVSIESIDNTYCVCLIQQAPRHSLLMVWQDSERMSGDIHSSIIHAIPNLVLETHQAAALRMVGSIAQLSTCTEEEIMAVTDLSQSQYVQPCHRCAG